MPERSSGSSPPSEYWEQPEQVEAFAGRAPDHRLTALLEAEREPSALRVLDLGCAGGRNTLLLAERGCDVVAVDASAAMVETTRRRLAAMLGEEEARRRVRRGPMDDLGWIETGSIDLLVALGIYHAAASRDEWDRTLSESARVLAKGGRLLVSVFGPGTDLTGEGTRPVPGEESVVEGFPDGRRATLVDAATLDRELARFGLVPITPTATVEVEAPPGRRVTVNGLFQKATASLFA